MISEQEDTARRRAKQAKAMTHPGQTRMIALCDNWAEVYGEDVHYLLGQLRKARKQIKELELEK